MNVVKELDTATRVFVFVVVFCICGTRTRMEVKKGLFTCNGGKRKIGDKAAKEKKKTA